MLNRYLRLTIAVLFCILATVFAVANTAVGRPSRPLEPDLQTMGIIRSVKKEILDDRVMNYPATVLRAFLYVTQDTLEGGTIYFVKLSTEYPGIGRGYCHCRLYKAPDDVTHFIRCKDAQPNDALLPM